MALHSFFGIVSIFKETKDKYYLYIYALLVSVYEFSKDKMKFKTLYALFLFISITIILDLELDAQTKVKIDTTGFFTKYKNFYLKSLSLLSESPDSSIIYANKSLFFLEQLEPYKQDKNLFYSAQAEIYNILFEAYFYIDDFEHSKEYNDLILKNAQKINNKALLSTAYINFGIFYRRQRDYQSAIANYKKAMILKKELKDSAGIDILYTNLGVCYEYKGEPSKALIFYRKSFNYEKNRGNLEDLSNTYINLGGIFLTLNYLDSSEFYLKKSLGIADSMKLAIDKEYDFDFLSQVFEKKGDFVTALDYYKKLDSLKYERISTEKMTEQQTLAEKYNKKLNENKIRQLNKDKNTQRKIIYLLIFAMFIFGVLIAIIIISYRKLKYYNNQLLKLNAEINEQKAEITAQRDDIEEKNELITHQYELLEKRNNDLNASLDYAKRIQESIFPKAEVFQNYFSDYFILYRPKEKVGGDFYWAIENNNDIFVAVGDSTGHGVPGALLSFMGIAGLNQIYSHNNNIRTDRLLDRFREQIINNFQKTKNKTYSNQSIDIALINYNKELNTLQFSGAYNSIFLVRNGVLTEYKADKIPVGNSRKIEIKYSLTELDLQKDDIIYLYSDGYQDQLGGRTSRKFLKSKFRDLIEGLNTYGLDEQKKILEVVLEGWKSEIFQVDDICVVALKI